MATLSTPSDAVQSAVAECLAPLVKSIKADGKAVELLHASLAKALEGGSSAERRGGAQGVAATLKGLGLAALKTHDVLGKLQEAVDGGSDAKPKKSRKDAGSKKVSAASKRRQGALFVYECLSARLGILFEPYVIKILPLLLQCFADGEPIVRDASQAAARGIMAKLSGHGVKLVMPALLAPLEGGEDKTVGATNSRTWRSKVGAVEMLGAMAYCAPRQLSTA